MSPPPPPDGGRLVRNHQSSIFFKYSYLLITISHVLSLLSCSSTSTTSYIRNYNTGTLKITYYWMMDERGHLLAIIKKYQTKRRRSLQLRCQWERLSLLSPMKRGDDTGFVWLVVVSIEEELFNYSEREPIQQVMIFILLVRLLLLLQCGLLLLWGLSS